MKSDKDSQEAALISTLAATVGVIAIWMAVLGWASWLEAFSFVTGAACVWLTVKESIWNFPIGLANVAAYCVVFFQARLFADAGLQIIYFGLGIMGWYLWLRGGDNRFRLAISRASDREIGVLLLLLVVATASLWYLLDRVGGSATFWDALTTSISLASQWLLNRKRLESWLGWIAVDIIYIPLYAYKGLYLTAFLYFVFLLMAIQGLRSWRKTWLTAQVEKVRGPLTQADVP